MPLILPPVSRNSAGLKWPVVQDFTTRGFSVSDTVWGKYGFSVSDTGV